MNLNQAKKMLGPAAKKYAKELAAVDPRHVELKRLTKAYATVTKAKSVHTPEGQVVKSVLAYLDARGIYAWRNNSGCMKLPGRFVRFGKVGSSDILGILPGGIMLAIECKSDKGKLTAEQAGFLAEIHDRGGVAIVARTVDDVIKQLPRSDK